MIRSDLSWVEFNDSESKNNSTGSVLIKSGSINGYLSTALQWSECWLQGVNEWFRVVLKSSVCVTELTATVN